MEDNLNNENFEENKTHPDMTVVKTKKRMDKKYKVTIVALSLLLAIALTSTIALAAFQANKTSSATISFANGLTLKLEATATSDSTIRIATANASVSGTFTYSATSGNSMTNLTSNVVIDGIKGTLNQAGYLAYSILLKEGSSNIVGSWAALTNTGTSAVFTPTSGAKNWRAKITLAAGWTASAVTSNTYKIQNATQIAANTATPLFSKLEFYCSGTAANVTDLAGRSIIMSFKVVADTTSGSNAAASL